MIVPSQAVIAAAQRARAKFAPKGELASVCIAQYSVESEWGRFPSGKNNFFGIKATKAQIAAGQATSRMTHEFINGQNEYLPQFFADYDSVDTCFEAHAELLMKSWYRDVQAARTYDAQAEALLKDHYATAPNYAAALIAIIKTKDRGIELIMASYSH